ncbi:MAG TPA: hypothetical protein VJC18_06680, partial [bacterium]|nr:hypothetical protein [bacterium]
MRTYAMIILVLIFLVPASVLAAGPMINYGDTSGDTIVSMPPVWDNSAPIEYTIESGTCGPFSNDEMVEKYEDILAVWSDIEGVDISFSAVTGEIGSIDDSNYADYFYYGLEGEDVTVATDGINPVMFDDDGALTDALFGTGGSSSVLGFASVTGLDDDALYDGEVVINCKCMEDHPTENCDEVVFSEEDLSFTITHEMGHFLNMGHSQANYNLMIDWAADDFDEATKPFGDGDLPIMFPTSSDMTEVIPQADDVLTLKQLYPSGSLSDDYCKVEGYIVDSEGEYVPCLDVWAVTEDEDPAETLTVTTGSSNTYGTGTGDDFDPDA